MNAQTTRKITHEEAKEIALRLIAGAFHREDNRPRFSIPCRPDHDDDCLMIAYIEQQAAYLSIRAALQHKEQQT